MTKTLPARTRRRLNVQGLCDIDDNTLAEVGAWLRLAYGLCTLLAAIGTVLASPLFLLILAPIAALGALFSVHPFDLIYNYGIRHLLNTEPLPKRAAQGRFACGIGTVWLIVTAWAFNSGLIILGYILGGLLTIVGLLVSTVDICIPSMIYNALFLHAQNK